MHDLLEQTFHFQKTASRRRVKGGRLDWEASIHESLSETAPYVIDGGNQVEIDWDEQDPETGFALGKVIVWNRPPLPPVMATQMQAMKQEKVEDPGKAVTIPIHVRGFDLFDPSVFIDSDGHAHALTEKRWTEQMGTPDAFGPLDPNANAASFQQGAPTHALPAEAAGYSRAGQSNIGGGGAKFASDSQLPLLEAALGPASAPLLDPYDQERMRKTAEIASMVAGLGRTRAFPAVQFILGAPSRSLSQYQVDAVDQQPRSIAFIQQTAAPPLGSRGLQFKTTLVGQRYYDPVEHEGDYASTVELLKGLVPDIAQRLAAGGDHVIRLTPSPGLDPFVLEDLSLDVRKVMGRGCYFVMDAHTQLCRMDAVMNVHEWSGEPTGQMLLIGDEKWSMSINAVGRRIAEFGQTVKCQAPGSKVKSTQWVSIVVGDPTDPDAKWLAPCRVIDDTCKGGRRIMYLVSYQGEDIALMFVPGVCGLVSADGVKWPDTVSGNAKFMAPEYCKIVPLGCQTVLEENPDQLEATLQSYVQARSDMVIPARGTVRFTTGAMSTAPYVTLIHNANAVLMGDDWTMRGEALRGVLGDNEQSNMRASQVQFTLAVLGASEGEVSSLMSKAQSRGQITIGGLCAVQAAMNTDGTAKAPYLRKLAQLSLHIRDVVDDDARNCMLKAAACIGIANVAAPVAELLGDEEVVRKLAYLGSVFETLAVHGGPEGLIKVGEALADPESIDVMLGLNVVNERNVQVFLAELQSMLDVEDRLAELLLLSRQGLKGVDPDDCEEALTALNGVNEKLEYLQTTVRQDKLQAS